MKIEVELKGFTPVLDNLIEEYDLVTATIYGIVWRYAQMSNKVCNASLHKIGERVKLSGKTAARHIKTLSDGGYLVDLTPDLRNKPHTYAVTGKAELSGAIAAHQDRESYLGGTESPTRQDRESYLGGTESPLKKDSKKDNKDIKPKIQNSKTDYTENERAELNVLVKAIAKSANGSITDEDELRRVALVGHKIAKIVKLDVLAVEALGKSNLAPISGLAIQKSGLPNIDAKLKSFEAWWYNEYWLGKDKNQPPSLKQMTDAWLQFEDNKVGPRSSSPDLSDAKKARLAELTALYG